MFFFQVYNSLSSLSWNYINRYFVQSFNGNWSSGLMCCWKSSSVGCLEFRQHGIEPWSIACRERSISQIVQPVWLLFAPFRNVSCLRCVNRNLIRKHESHRAVYSTFTLGTVLEYHPWSMTAIATLRFAWSREIDLKMTKSFLSSADHLHDFYSLTTPQVILILTTPQVILICSS